MGQNIVPQILDLHWGPGEHERVDIWQNSVRVSSGNPVIFFKHGGGAVQGDKKQPWCKDLVGNSLFSHVVSGASPIPFDLMSVESEQSAFTTLPTVPVDHPLYGSTWHTQERITRAVHYPDSFFALHRFVRWLKQHAKGRDKLSELHTLSLPDNPATNRPKDLGCSPVDIVPFGFSFGAQQCMLLGLTAPRVGQARPDAMGRYGPMDGSSSVPAILTFGLPIDFRSRGGDPTNPADEWIDCHLGFPSPTISQGYFNAGLYEEWARIKQEIKARISVAAYYEKPAVSRFHTPFLGLWENVNPVPPAVYPPISPMANPHDQRQGTRLAEIMTAAGYTQPDNYLIGTIAVDGWDHPVTGPQINANIIAWLDDRLFG